MRVFFRFLYLLKSFGEYKRKTHTNNNTSTHFLHRESNKNNIPDMSEGENDRELEMKDRKKLKDTKIGVWLNITLHYNSSKRNQNIIHNGKILEK